MASLVQASRLALSARAPTAARSRGRTLPEAGAVPGRQPVSTRALTSSFTSSESRSSLVSAVASRRPSHIDRLRTQQVVRASAAVAAQDGGHGKGGWSVHALLDAGLGSIVLIAATAMSLYLSNSALADQWLHFWHIHAGPAALGLNMSLKEWVNEGLMAIFFFVVGMDIKKEFVYGSLSSIRQALLPCLGAVGGMVVPMLFYLALNMSGAVGSTTAGWAVPMATDIAFAMGVYGFFRNRMPMGAQAFLLTLATVDDLGAILVIALFFAKHVAVQYLTAAAAICGGLWYAERKGSERSVPAIIVAGVALWYCLLKGGINADVAGVVAALALPTPKAASAEGTVLEKLHAKLAPVTALLIMPAFALANCAVPLDAAMFSKVFVLGAGLGPMVGLLIGKPLGIAGLSFLAVKLGWASWPTGMQLKHLLVVGVLGGIGFTMSLFLIQCSFVGAAAPFLNVAKLGVFLGSIAAAFAGAGLMMLFPAQKAETPSESFP